MSQDNQELPQSEDFWADEFKHAQPEPSAEFLHRLDQKMAVRAEQLQMENNPMFITRPNFSTNGYHADMPPIYQVKPRRLPHLRWIAVASILTMILIGGFLSFSTGDDPLPTQSAIQNTRTPAPQQVADCTITPQTGWVVHVVGAESLAEIAEQYQQTTDLLMQFNCLPEDILADGQILYIPTELTRVWVANQPIVAGTAITDETVELLYMLNSEGFMFPDFEITIGQYALADIASGDVINNQPLGVLQSELEYDGQIFTAIDGQVVIAIPFPDFTNAGSNSNAMLSIGGWEQFDCSFFPETDVCSNIITFMPALPNTLPPEIEFSITILHDSPIEAIVSLSEENALILEQLSLIYPDYSTRIIETIPLPNHDHVVMSVPITLEQYNQIKDIARNEAISVQVEILYCELEPPNPPQPYSTADIENCDAAVIQTVDYTMPVILQSVMAVNNTNTSTFAGVVMLSLLPTDVVTLEWIIESDLDIRFAPSTD